MSVNEKSRTQRPGLLISVRDLVEAKIACEADADLIDVKEPDRGSLGAADPQTLRAIAEDLAGRIPLSAALGELVDADRQAAQLPAAYQFAKFGLAGAAKIDWQTALKRGFAQLPPHVRPVAVIYADWKTCAAPSPDEVCACARELGVAAVLIDTFNKDGSTLFDHFTFNQIGELISLAAQADLICVLAGGLSIDLVPAAASFHPDYIAVRGAACDGDRQGNISLDAIRRIKRIIMSDHAVEEYSRASLRDPTL